jgi:cytochrome c peroxidase
MKFAIATALAVLAAFLLHAQTRLGYGSSSIYGAGDASSRAWWAPGESLTLVARWNYDDPDGTLGILNANGAFKVKDHPFFEPIGSNGRACVTCHQPADAMSLSTASIRERWNETHGDDPLFSAFDGANCPGQPRAQLASHSLLLERGLIRIPLAWPPKSIQPDFKLEVLRDPTGCALKNGEISVYRRPRQTANLRYIRSGRNARILSDAREKTLESQAISAALGHLEMRSHPTAEQIDAIVAFETQVYSAQSMHRLGGRFTGPDVDPEELLARFSDLSAWRNLPPVIREMEPIRQLRMSASRGLDVFTKQCAQCHDGHMTGVSPTTAPVNIGTTISPTWTDPTGLPVFRITCDNGRVAESTDPGRALITGRCADLGAISAQQLRGLSARAPYFVNGSAKTLKDVVDYYDRRFSLGFSVSEKEDLVNFLSVL